MSRMNSPGSDISAPKPSSTTQVSTSQTCAWGEYERVGLPNGMDLHLIHMPGTPYVQITAGLEVGSRNERPHEFGVAHFLEHMQFESGIIFPNSETRDTELAKAGGSVNASTGKEQTTYHASVPNSCAGLSLDIVDELTLPVPIGLDRVTKHRDIICAEMAHCDARDPLGAFHRHQVMPWLFSGTPLEHPVIGQPEAIRAFTPENVLDFRTRCYREANLKVAVSGNFDDKFKDEVIKRFGGRIDLHTEPVSPGGLERSGWESANTDSRILAQHCPVPAVTVRLFFPAPNKHDLLGQSGFGEVHRQLTAQYGRMHQIVREERRLVYGVSSWGESFKETGYACLEFVAQDQENLASILKVIRKELDDLCAKGPKQHEITGSRGALASWLRGAPSDFQGAGNAAVYNAICFGKVRLPEEVVETSRSLDTNYFKGMYQKYFRPGLARVALFGDLNRLDMSALKRQVESL